MAPKTRKSSSSSKKKSAVTATKPRKKRNSRSANPTVSVSVGGVTSTVSSVADPPPPSTVSSVSNENIATASTSNVTDFSSAAAVSNLISTTDIFEGDTNERISKLQLNTAKYTSSVTGVVKHFFGIISKHPSLHNLSDVIQDPTSSEGTLEYRLVILTHGTKNHDKYKILNTSLLVAAMNIKLQKHSDIDLTKRYDRFLF